MYIETKNREAILQYLFREGVIVAENKNQKKHAGVEGVTNLEVIQLMRGFETRKLVKRQYAWRHHYYFITDEGITHLRDILHIPADILPATLKKTASTVAPVEGDGRRTWRDRGVEGREGRTFGGRGAGGDRNCYQCGKPGHMARDCAGDVAEGAAAAAPKADAPAAEESW
eukprot:TRINITY_DN27766_c0_g1_i1.p2 TRINITY_DN27766_c0_g1~~TRINITY_DN27766_c0_g1_i1.p2  ORF type:complete len:171 (+),score=42.67 TRINITY_DN27766_c0_g1_i1:51-563(+)